MKRSLLILLAISLITDAVNSQLVKEITNKRELKVESGYKYTPSRHNLNSRAGDTACQSIQLSNTFYDYQHGSYINSQYTFKGNWYTTTASPLAVFLSSKPVVSNKFAYSKIVAKFDRLVRGVYGVSSIDTVVPSKTYIKIDSLTVFGNIMRDTTEIDSVLNDSLFISLYNSSAGTLGTKVFDSIYTGQALKKFMIGNGSVGSRKIPFNHQFPKNQTFSITIQYFSDKSTNDFVVCYGYVDSCGNLAAIAPRLFSNQASYYYLDSISPTSVAESQEIKNFFGYSNYPANCSYIRPQTYYVIPQITICEELQGTIILGKERPCYKEQVTAYAVITGGKPPYTYSWTATGGVTLHATNLDSAIFQMNKSGNFALNLTVTDAGTNQVILSKTVANYTPTFSSFTLSPNRTLLQGCTDSITITVPSTNNTTYEWSGKSSSTTRTAVAKEAGIYNVKLTFIPSGCVYDSSITITSSFSAPTLSFTYTPSVVCQNKNVTFKVASSAIRTGWTYKWKDGSTALSDGEEITHQFTTSGTKPVYLNADSSGCSAAQVSQNIDVKSATSSSCTNSISTAITDNIKIYPNPVREGKIYVESNLNKTLIVRVTDLLGKTITTEKLLPNRENQIDMSSSPNGIYFVEVESGADRIVKKIVVDQK